MKINPTSSSLFYYQNLGNFHKNYFSILYLNPEKKNFVALRFTKGEGKLLILTKIKNDLDFIEIPNKINNDFHQIIDSKIKFFSLQLNQSYLEKASQKKIIFSHSFFIKIFHNFH